MISTKEAWLSAKKVPSVIPHYLSDYWLTYNLFKAGFLIVHPPDFVCRYWQESTRNKLSSCVGASWYQLKLKALYQLVDAASPGYAPAWLAFWSQPPVRTKLALKILYLRLKHKFAQLMVAFKTIIRFVALQSMVD